MRERPPNAGAFRDNVALTGTASRGSHAGRSAFLTFVVRHRHQDDDEDYEEHELADVRFHQVLVLRTLNPQTAWPVLCHAPSSACRVVS